jgi:hypothetical protein
VLVQLILGKFRGVGCYNLGTSSYLFEVPSDLIHAKRICIAYFVFLYVSARLEMLLLRAASAKSGWAATLRMLVAILVKIGHMFKKNEMGHKHTQSRPIPTPTISL